MAIHTSVKKLGKGVMDRMLDQPVFVHPFKPKEKAMALMGWVFNTSTTRILNYLRLSRAHFWRLSHNPPANSLICFSKGWFPYKRKATQRSAGQRTPAGAEEFPHKAEVPLTERPSMAFAKYFQF